MPDREKVINGLEREVARTDLEWLDCVEVKLLKDALVLLKAQEPIEARLNLCESCAKEYVECEADKTDLVYGSGVGNDNIIGCPWYVNRWKSQEPRVMTLEEVSKWHNVPESERDPIYVEYLPNSGLGISRWTTEYFGFNPNSYPNRNSGYYGKWLRCWTSRPDEKRMAETPWMT